MSYGSSCVLWIGFIKRKEEQMCHRSIIAGLLHGVGCNVVSAFGTNISRYDMYYKLYCDENNK